MKKIGIVASGSLLSCYMEKFDEISKDYELIENKPIDWNYKEGSALKVFDDYNIVPSAPVKPFVREQKKVGRNELCTCQSGKKYKNCCINK